MKVSQTDLPGVLLIEPDVYRDPRGHFLETWNAERYAEAGIAETFVQDNVSLSNVDVLRGLHYQYPNPQGKLVQVLQGEVFDVAVDIREGSPFFGKSFCITLSEENCRQLYIPAGFAHGFCVTQGPALFYYKCTAPYDPSAQRGIHHRDSALNIAWPTDHPVLSKQDELLPPMIDLSSEEFQTCLVASA